MKKHKILVNLFITFAVMILLTSAAFAQSDEQAGCIGLLIMGGMGLVGLAIYGGILYWVYKDASVKSDNALMWTLIVAFTGFLGLIIYLIVGRNKQG